MTEILTRLDRIEAKLSEVIANQGAMGRTLANLTGGTKPEAEEPEAAAPVVYRTREQRIAAQGEAGARVVNVWPKEF